MMKIIETEAIQPQPVRKEADSSEVEEIYVFGTNDMIIGTEWRLKGVKKP